MQPLLHNRLNFEFDGEHPAARFEADCALQLEVCRFLLSFADGLSDPLDPDVLSYLTRILPSTWAAHITFQSEVGFPLLRRRYDCDAGFAQCIARCEQQHIEIAGLTEELVERLEAIAEGESVDAEALGYLVRNASERRREHTEHELAVLDLLFPRILAPVERQEFLAWAAKNPWPIQNLQQGAGSG